jgi:hypothetical protein
MILLKSFAAGVAGLLVYTILIGMSRTEAQLKGREQLPEAWAHSLRADECV